MIKNFTLIVLFLFSALNVFAADTTKINAHNNTHMNWYGNFDKKVKFPDNPNDFKRIWMTVTLGCPATGCSEWDYTVQIILRKPAGYNDTFNRTYRFFNVENNSPDTLFYSKTPVYKYFWNVNLASLDSSIFSQKNINFQFDSINPNTPDSTSTIYLADFWNYNFDNNGSIIDSFFVIHSDTLFNFTKNYKEYLPHFDNFELGRLITPYANGFPLNWKFPYKYDVTDLAPLLTDSSTVRLHYSGYQDGFTASVDFDFIQGSPNKIVKRVLPVYFGSFPYGSLSNPIEKFLSEKEFSLISGENDAMFRVIQTGHGFGGNENCAEFCPKYNFVLVNGVQKFENLVWKDDCGFNPIFPQPGTWLYDRANWCPGSLVKPFDHNLTPHIPQGNFKVNLDVEPFVNVNNNNCSYIISSYLFTYDNKNVNNDISIDEILAPNNDIRYSRFNPSCGTGEIEVKNLGNNEITKLKIVSTVNGANPTVFEWEGQILPGASKQIIIPEINYASNQNIGQININITEVNGVQDPDMTDNSMNASFDLPIVIPGNEFAIWHRANNAASENSYAIYDMNNPAQPVLVRNGFSNGGLSRDTIRLVNGCYKLEFYDDGEDGIAWWANPNAGSGTLSMRRVSGTIIKTFNPDFGSKIVQYFTVGFTLNQDHLMNNETANNFELFPNPSNSAFEITNLSNLDFQEIKIYDMSGKCIYSDKIKINSGSSQSFDLNLNSGVYMVELINSIGNTEVKKLVINK